MYHYTESGLDNVWLTNGYIKKQTRYGEAIAFEDVAGLHDAIGHVLVKKGAALSGSEFRFLRKELGLSQESLGEIMGVTNQAVAIWEKNDKVPLLSDLFIRGVYQETMSGNAELLDAIKTVNQAEHENYKMDLAFNGQWHKCI